MSEHNVERAAMPPKVAGAISAIMKAVPKLAKGEKNTHGNYNFASIDDFLEAVRPLCAEHGLIIMQDEESFDLREGTDRNNKPVAWLVMRFAFTLAHSSGETWAHRPMRTIMVNASMGAQAFGAAQSYALKQFERSLFQIATGEKGNDADEHPPGDLVKGNGKTSAKTAEPKAEQPEWKAEAERIKAAIDKALNQESLDAFMKQEKATLARIKAGSETAYEFLMTRAGNRLAVWAQQPEAAE